MASTGHASVSPTTPETTSAFEWVGLGVEVAGFSLAILVLWTTRQSLEALILQIKSQAAHSLVGAHRSLFMPIITSRSLARLATANETNSFSGKMLASMMINHASAMFSDVKNGLVSGSDMDTFERDLLDLFALPIVRDRWGEVREFHQKDFIEFVDCAVTTFQTRQAQTAAEARRLDC